MCGISIGVLAQQSISGIISDAKTQETLPGVTIATPDATQGTISNFEGSYSLVVDAAVDTLVFSYIGYKSLRVPVQGQSVINVLLEADDLRLNEVVVTALGISREKKSLGYSATDVQIESLATIKDVNVVNNLAGKVAGLRISKTSGGLASSTRVILRGNSSFRDNQALFVIDGVPIDNSTNGSADLWGGIDYGSGAADINPDDIEQVSVLKGAGAAALYGSRAANGVIMITTKKGKARKGIGLSINSTSTFESPDIQLQFQDIYGAGVNGKFDVSETGLPFFETAINNRYGDSWGPKMEGQPYVDWDGVERTYSPQPNNYREFFELGYTLTNSLALDGGNEKTSFRLGYTNVTNKGTSPNSSLHRHTLSFRGTHRITTRLQADFKISYINQAVKNRLSLSNSGAARHIVMMPRNISDNSLRDYADEEGLEKIWYTSWAWQNNPYWEAYENVNQDWRNRYMGHISVRYDINSWLQLLLRTGQDFYTDRRDNIEQATGSFANRAGAFSQAWLQVAERNTDFLLTSSHQLSDKWHISGNIGGNRLVQAREYNSLRNAQLSEPHFYHIEYSQQPISTQYNKSQKRINSLYALAQISYNNYLYIDLSGRHDWSSTLPTANNNYFYPSVNTSFVFSDAFTLPQWCSFGKIRASYAVVGSDADPYQTQTTFIANGTYNGSEPRVSVQNTIGAPQLKPEFTYAYEFGTDIRLWNNAVGLDVSYYNNRATDVIVEADIANSTGFTKAVLNAATIVNKGIEASIQLRPVNTRQVRWNIQGNFTKNNSLVESLDEAGKLNTLVLEEQFRISVEGRAGYPYGVIVAPAIARNEAGEALIAGDGTFVKSDTTKVHGHINPDWTMGITNELSIGNFTLNFLIDIKQGGHIYSATNMYGNGYSGALASSLEGRSAWYESEAAREAAGINAGYYNEANNNWVYDWMPTGGYLAAGIYADGTIINGEDVSGESNTIYINPKNYWAQFSAWTDELHEPHIYDASFVKLREASISYRFPNAVAQKLGVRGASVALIGRNLWLIHSNLPNVDPEASYNNGNAQGGIEWGTYPVNRSVGCTLTLQL